MRVGDVGAGVDDVTGMGDIMWIPGDDGAEGHIMTADADDAYDTRTTPEDGADGRDETAEEAGEGDAMA